MVEAARAEFAERGVEGTSMRSVARRAGVDPKTVKHWFADRGELVAATVIPDATNPAEAIGDLLDGGTDGLGRRLAARILGAWEAEGGPDRFRLYLGGLSRAGHREELAGVLARGVLPRLREALPDADPRRLAIATSLLAGALVTRHLLRLEPMAGLPLVEAANLIGDAIQAALTGPLPPPTSAPTPPPR